MKFNSKNPLTEVLSGLFESYQEHVPDVQRITDALVQKGVVASQEAIVNDHIAFRTLGLPHLGIASLEKIFLYLGYEKRDYYRFNEKKLNAYWYAPPSETYPRIFISELCVNELSKTAQDIIHKYTEVITEDPVLSIDLENPADIIQFFMQPLWELPTWEDYQTLLQESEYAAWVIYNRYYLNHYTISVHELPVPWNSLAVFNDFLQDLGIRLNTAGGMIKTSPDGLLLQSSTVAQTMVAQFACGNHKEISGSYVEFAERKILPQYSNQSNISREQRREGFEAGNADKIFESTFTSQTKKL